MTYWHAEAAVYRGMLFFVCFSDLKCYPWLETEASAAGGVVSLYTQLTETVHHKFRGRCEASAFRVHISAAVLSVIFLNSFLCVAERLLPDQRGALWLCLMQYCESCTAPRTPEYLLYLYHTHLRSLPWRHLHPDTLLMEQLFNVRLPASPKTLTPPTLHSGLDTQRTGEPVDSKLGFLPASFYY